MTGEVSQAVNEFLVKENARLSAEVKELRDTVSFARDQWKLMQSVVDRLERMDRRLELALSERDRYDDSRDMQRLARMKADKYSANTNSSF